MPSILLTGAAGFIYSAVARHFVQHGWDVTIADHFDMQGKGQNLANILPDVRLLIGDLATGALAERCAEVHADYIVHAAAYTHVDDAIADPERFMTNNILGTTRLLQALWAARRTHGELPQKMLIISTDEVFGATPPGQYFREDAPYNPSNAYAASKVGVEAIARSFFHTHQLPVIVMRPCNTYGPGQFPAKVIPKFIQQMLTGQPVTLYNDGRGSRDWLHVQDHAQAIQVLLERGKVGDAYNLGANDEHSDLDIYENIGMILLDAGIVPEIPPPTFVPGRPGHDRRYAMKTDKLRALGWQPRIPFTDGFRETVLWNVEHRDWWSHDFVKIG